MVVRELSCCFIRPLSNNHIRQETDPHCLSLHPGVENSMAGGGEWNFATFLSRDGENGPLG